MKTITLFLFSVLIIFVEAIESSDREIEARGKGKYALITHLAILLAAKIGLFKICLGIALVLGTIKLGVFMAWALAIFKYVPDPYIYHRTVEYKPNEHYGPFHGSQHYGQLEGHDIHFFYVVATKLFVLKVVYGIIFYVLISKAWHFGLWFIHYLKEKKHEHYDYIEHDPYHSHHDNDHDHSHYDHGHYDHYGSSHQPYQYDKYGYGGKSGFDSFGSSSYANTQDSVGSYSNYNKNYASSSSTKNRKGVYDSDGSYSVRS